MSDYPYKAKTDARSAMTETLAEYVSTIDFTLPRAETPFRFVDVHSTWSDFNQRAMSEGGMLPAAAILPDRPIYDAISLTPFSIDDTWQGGDPTLCNALGKQIYPIGDGSGDGICLFGIAEITTQFVLIYRALTKPMRAAIARRLEQVFVEDGGLVPDVSQLNPNIPVGDVLFHPIRYGRVFNVPKYYNRTVRLTLIAQQTLDAESSAGENRWMGQMEFEGQMLVCVPRRVRSMKTRIITLVNDVVANGSIIAA